MVGMDTVCQEYYHIYTHLCKHNIFVNVNYFRIQNKHKFLHIVIHADKLYICTNFILTLAIQTPAVHLFNMHSCNTYKFSYTHLYGFKKEKILLEQVCVVHFDSNESNYHYQVSDIIIQVRCLFNIHSMNSQVLFIVHLILTSLL